MKVPFLDLNAQYPSIQDEIRIALQEVLDNTAFAGGPFVEQFEWEFAQYCRCKYAVGVSSGTSALWLTLLALGVGQGDQVITVPNTFIATAEAISFCGAKPVFVDIDERIYNMDPALLEAAITERTKAFIPVHLYGQCADMDPILATASKYGLYVIEDACQAHGSEYKGLKAGSMGHAACFSFYPGKNLGAFGDAGAVVTNNDELAGEIRMLRDHGQTTKYRHSRVGWNARMDGFQGAGLSVKLKYLDEWNADRRRNAELYNKLLVHADGLITPFQADYAKHVYHIYAIRTRRRDALIEALKDKDIHCGIHYPVPIHLQDAYKFLEHKKGSFPIAEKCAEELVSLPMFPELSREQIEKVARDIIHFQGS